MAPLLLLQLAAGQTNPYGPCALNPGTMYGSIHRVMQAFSMDGLNGTLHDYSQDDHPDPEHSTFCHLDPRPTCNSSCVVRVRAGQDPSCGTAEHAAPASE